MAEDMDVENCREVDKDGPKPERMFTLKKWNLVAMWSWDVECDTCAICRVQVMVVWGECNHSFHNCCMSLWVKQNNRCPLCQQEWVVQRIGK
ncbi:RING-box protein 2-like [Octopus bimaculoides]|uniref:RING-box protein 2 n=1 Tax=Octopus sinensis TaxID=2607531 RepID=A0A6P7TBF8_9MOLL|nr:RING-box protein 2 [Octopus sinensis]XP_052830806.1 RING-box protein 2-like [Octopus bimaculoides]